MEQNQTQSNWQMSQTPTPKSRNKIFLIISVLVLVAGVFIWYFLPKNFNINQNSMTNNSKDWQTYTSSDLGISLRYPTLGTSKYKTESWSAHDSGVAVEYWLPEASGYSTLFGLTIVKNEYTSLDEWFNKKIDYGNNLVANKVYIREILPSGTILYKRDLSKPIPEKPAGVSFIAYYNYIIGSPTRPTFVAYWIAFASSDDQGGLTGVQKSTYLKQQGYESPEKINELLGKIAETTEVK